MQRWLKNPKIVVATLVALGGLLWLAFGYFAVQTLFVDDKVNEAAPVFATTTIADTANAPTTPPALDTPTTTAAAPTTTAAPVVVTEYSGMFVSRDHTTSGNALVLGNGTGQRFLRFEQFETENGPDLNVYLVNSSAGGVIDFVDLGDLKGNIGDQNYEIPAGVDLSVHDTVVIWCVRFSSPFGEALLTTA